MRMPKTGVMPKVGIDIGEQAVKIIHINHKGFIKRAAVSRINVNPHDPEYPAVLTKAIREAAKTARIKKGKCVLVTGGANVIIQRFTWPDMPPEALKLNAETEIAPYLPAETGLFNIDYKVISRKSIGEPGSAGFYRLEVFVAAMPKETSETLTDAARAAGFKAERIDVRENARDKLIGYGEVWYKEPGLPDEIYDTGVYDSENEPVFFNRNKSFAVLDITDSLANMTVFINGEFYVSRYFGYAEAKSPEEEEPDVLAPYVPEVFPPVPETDTLAAEAASVIDFIHYRERGTNVEILLFYGRRDDASPIISSLSEYLEIPVFMPANRLTALPRRKAPDSEMCLDAYGALLTPRSKEKADIDLKQKKISRRIFARFVLPALLSFMFLAGAVLSVVYYFESRIAMLTAEEETLSSELRRYSVTEADVTLISDEIARMNQSIDELVNFYSDYPNAAEALAAVTASLPRGANITDFSLSYGTVHLTGIAESLSAVSEYMDNLGKNPLVYGVTAQTAVSSSQEGRSLTDFRVSVILNNGKEGGYND